MTHSFTHIDPAQMIQGLTAETDCGSSCVSVHRAHRAHRAHRTDHVFPKASWLDSVFKTTVKTIFVTRGEGKPSDD